MANTSSSEEHAARLRDFAKECRELVHRIPQLTRELETILLQHNAFDMLANLSVTNLMNDPETFKEYEQTSLSVHVEFPAQLYLKHAFSDGDGSPLIAGPTLEDVDRRIHEVCECQVRLWQYDRIDEPLEELERAVNHLRRRTLVNELAVRELMYPHQLQLLLTELFGSLTTIFEARFGFSLDELISTLEAVRDLIHARVNQRRHESDEFMSNLQSGAKQYRAQQQPLVDAELLPIITQIVEASGDDDELILRAGVAECFWKLGDLLSVTSEDVARQSGVKAHAVDACLTCFSQEFGSENRDLLAPQPIHRIRTRPLMHHGGRFLAPNPQLLLPAVRPRIEELLKADNKTRPRSLTWNSYEAARSRYLESKSVELLNRILQGAESYEGLKYRFPYDGQKQEFELDGLLRLEDTLFLVETKAGILSDPARRGAPQRMLKDLEELLANAFRQGLRAKQYIASTPTPVFATRDGATATLDRAAINQIFVISVVLDDLFTFTTVLAETAKLGIFPDGDLPWAVSLGDLMVISDLVEYPSQFIHYLRRRQEINRSDLLFTMSELDWFGKYLDDGLVVKGAPNGATRINVASYTTEIDEWYRHQSGERTTYTEKPQQKLPTSLRNILTRLDASKSPSRLAAAQRLLDGWAFGREDTRERLEGFSPEPQDDIVAAVTQWLARVDEL